MKLPGLLIAVAAVVLIHAGFSAVHYRSVVEERYGDIKTPIPLDVFVECGIAMLLVLVGVVAGTGKLLPIYSSGEAPANSFHRLFTPRSEFAAIKPVAR